MENLTDEQLRRVTGNELRRLQYKQQEHRRLMRTLKIQRLMLVVVIVFLMATSAASLWMLAVLK